MVIQDKEMTQLLSDFCLNISQKCVESKCLKCSRQNLLHVPFILKWANPHHFSRLNKSDNVFVSLGRTLYFSVTSTISIFDPAVLVYSEWLRKMLIKVYNTVWFWLSNKESCSFVYHQPSCYELCKQSLVRHISWIPFLHPDPVA